MPNQFTALSPEDRVEATEAARREARFRAARERIRRIVEAAPAFTEEQIHQLRVLLTPPPGR